MGKRRSKTKRLRRDPSLFPWIISLVIVILGLFGMIWNASDAAKSSVFWVGGLVIMIALSRALSLGVVLSTRRAVKECANLDQVAARLNLTIDEVRIIKQRAGLEPRYNIAGRDLYNTDDFLEAAKLLRPAEAPVGLLRAARSVDQSDEVLVRPAEGNNI